MLCDTISNYVTLMLTVVYKDVFSTQMHVSYFKYLNDLSDRLNLSDRLIF